MNKNVFGGLLIAASMCLFALIGPFVRYTELPGFVIIFYSALFGSALLFFYFVFTNGIKGLILKNHLFLMIVSTLFIVGNLYTFFKAYTMTTMANAVLTHYTAPVFAAVLAPVFLKEKLERITVLSLAISMTGLFFIASQNIAFGSQHFEGICFGTLSGVFYGILILINKRLVSVLTTSVILLYQTIITVIIIGPFMGSFHYTTNATNFLLMIVYTLVIFLFPAFLYLKGLRYVEAQHAGILAYTEPLVVVIFGIMFYNEIPTFKILVGGLLIFISGGLILKAEAERKIIS